MVPGHRKDEIVGQANLSFRSLQQHKIRFNRCDETVEVPCNLLVFDPIFDIRQDPIFHVTVHLRAAMHQRNPGAMPPQIERRNGRRIFSADHQHIGVKERMRLAVVVEHFGHVLARNLHHVGHVVVPG